jgi:hypothetical protein
VDERLVVGIFPPYRNTASGAAITRALPEIAFLHEKTHNTGLGIRGILVFWAGAGKNAVLVGATGVFALKTQNTVSPCVVLWAGAHRNAVSGA